MDAVKLLPRRWSAATGRGIRRGLVATVAAVVALATVAAPAAQAADQAPAQATVFTRGYDTASKVVTLTFDADYWSPGDVPTVLNILRENGITAAFSLTGRYVEKYPDQTRQIMAAGHKLVNHSYDHPDFTTLTQAGAALESSEVGISSLMDTWIVLADRARNGSGPKRGLTVVKSRGMSHSREQHEIIMKKGKLVLGGVLSSSHAEGDVA